MRICHITTVHPSRYDVRIFEKECRSLAAGGFEVILIVNDTLPDEERDGVKILSLRQIPRNRIDRASRIAKLALQKAKEVDAEIYHIHDPELLNMAVKLGKCGRKVVFDSHEFTGMQILTKEYLPSAVRRPIAYIYRIYEKKRLNKMSGLVYPCTYNGKDYFADIHVPKVMLGNYPSLKSLEDLPVRLTDDEREDKVCYVGSITESRGAIQMVKAAAIAGRKLILIGDMTKDIRLKLEMLPEFENVDYLGHLPHDIAMKEVSRCAVGLSLLQNEGQYPMLDNLPTKLYEYMALGIPTVISDFPYYKKQLARYKFGIAVDPSNEETIADAINQIMNDKKLSRQLMEEGKRAILEEMNWEIDAKKLIEFYKGL